MRQKRGCELVRVHFLVVLVLSGEGKTETSGSEE